MLKVIETVLKFLVVQLKREVAKANSMADSYRQKASELKYAADLSEGKAVKADRLASNIEGLLK